MSENKSSILKKFVRIESLLGILACFSAFIIAAPQAWFKQTFEFSPMNYRTILAADELTGGDSTAIWQDEKRRIWSCDMGSKEPKYCSAISSLKDENEKGVDLSNFQKMTVWIDYEGAAESVRVYFRNASNPYFKEGDPSTTKYNQIDIPVNKLSGGFSLDMEAFGVANWWLAANKILPKHSHPEFNNVIYIELQTGVGVFSKNENIQLKKIELEGVSISDKSIFRGLVLAWSALIFLLLAFRLAKLKYRLIQDSIQQKEMKEVNKLLELQNKEFYDLARTDQLTGLLNRLGIRDALYENLKAWKEKRIPFSFIIIDIDNFKKLNDTFGHDEGDKILKSVADLLHESTRKTDCLVRWGGEEFVLICQDSDLYRAHMIAEHLRKKLQASNIYPQSQVTASFGVASLTKPDIDDLFKRADQALYEAKLQGRNKVCVNSDVDFTEAQQ